MIWPLTWLVQLWHITIWPLTWLVQLWKVPRKTPLLAYINQEFVAIKRNCLEGTPVVSDCLSLAEGLGWWTAGSPLLGTPRLCWGSSTASLFLRSAPHISLKVRNKTWVPIFTTTIQYSFGSFGHSNQSRKRNKRNPNWKRSKTLTVCRWHDPLHRKP